MRTTFTAFTEFTAIAALASVLSACAGAPEPKAAHVDPDEPTNCVGGLCVRPDHVVARKLPDGNKTRCLLMAWDGSLLPPTAKVGVVDDSPARPGVFAAIDMPSLREGNYPVAPDPALGAPGSAAVFAVRVNPAAQFADQRIADGGSVSVAKTVDGAHIVIVESIWSDGHRDSATFVLPKVFDGCRY